MSTEKHVQCFLILNWRTGGVRIVNNMSRAKLNLTDIPIRLDLTLRIPGRQELTIKGEVKLSEAQVVNVAIDAFDQSS